MEPISIADATGSGHDAGDPYTELLRRASLSVGVYRLPAGGSDPQDPHDEDEVYHVVEGRASIRIGDEVHPVEPGDVVFVEKHVEHRFVDVETDLTVLVFFAPAEGSSSGA